MYDYKNETMKSKSNFGAFHELTHCILQEKSYYYLTVQMRKLSKAEL